MTLKVIGAGFGRTGTESLRRALNLLGLGPCHHMYEIIPNPDLRALWDRKTLIDDISWDTVFEGYRSAVDWPVAYYWEDLMEVYPEAKIVLTCRDPESWWASYERTILPALSGIRDRDDLGLTWRTIAEGEFGGQYDNREVCLARYIENIERARKIVPSDRFFEMQLGEGWPRLCAFLDVPVPDTPYPTGNSTAEFRKSTGMDDTPD